jgi:hypothetical protein
MPNTSMPRGSLLLIQATDLAINGGDGTVKYNKVSEHNRSEFNVGSNRIEEFRRMANGSLRKFFVAEKRTFTVSWDMLPSYRTLTVDAAWGAQDLRSFYNSTEGQGAFNIRVNFAKTGSNQESSGYEQFNVMFKDASFTVVKRGLQPHWSVSITLEEV